MHPAFPERPARGRCPEQCDIPLRPPPALQSGHKAAQTNAVHGTPSMVAAAPPCAPLILCRGCRGDPVAHPYLQPGHCAAVASGACQGDPSGLRGCTASPGLRAERRERKEERKRKEKRPNTSSHRKGSGKGSGKLNRRVQTFFGKAPAGPGCCAMGLAVPAGQEWGRASPSNGRARWSPRSPPLGRVPQPPELGPPGCDGHRPQHRLLPGILEIAQADGCWNSPVASPRSDTQDMSPGWARAGPQHAAKVASKQRCFLPRCAPGVPEAAVLPVGRGRGSEGRGRCPGWAESEPPSSIVPATRGCAILPAMKPGSLGHE